jgi:hypothetical protein
VHHGCTAFDTLVHGFSVGDVAQKRFVLQPFEPTHIGAAAEQASYFVALIDGHFNNSAANKTGSPGNKYFSFAHFSVEL